MMRLNTGSMIRPAVGWLVAGLLAGVGASRTVRAEHPSTASLLPETTAILLWIPDAPDAAERFMNTALGRILRDSQIKPMVDRFRDSLAKSMERAEGGIGVSLADLLSLAHGELALAVVAPEEDVPALVVLMDTGDRVSRARKLLDRISGGAGQTEVEVLGTKIVIVDRGGPRNQRMMFFEKDGTMVVGTNMKVLAQVLGAWNGKQGPTLAKNRKFRAIMRRSREENPKPQLVWYVDPITLMRSMGRGNPGIRMGLAMVPVLGLDGLEAFGGAIEWEAGQLDGILHMHLLLASPRSGVLEMLAFTSGDTTPERWVPAEVSTYTTFHWDVNTALESLRRLYDGFRGPGAFSEMLRQRIAEPSGLDVENDLLPALTGRVTYFTYFERPVTAPGSSSVVALELKTGVDLGAKLEEIFRAKGDVLLRRSSAGEVYYQFSSPRLGEGDPARSSPPKPCFGAMDDYLIVANQESLYQTVIATAAGSSERLADALDFKLVASKIRRRSGESEPVMVRFFRPEEDMRWSYDLAASEQTRQLVSRQAERNVFSRAINAALENRRLPPFSEPEKYLAPGGGLLTVDDEGIHYTGITLRRK